MELKNFEKIFITTSNVLAFEDAKRIYIFRRGKAATRIYDSVQSSQI